jgi:hypothetical protein
MNEPDRTRTHDDGESTETFPANATVSFVAGETAAAATSHCKNSVASPRLWPKAGNPLPDARTW